MTAALLTGAGVAAVAALAWACWAHARVATAKAEVYREFADTFRDLVPVYYSPRDRRRRDAKRRWMRLALVDPLVRDGLRDALDDADAHWRGTLHGDA